MSRGGRLCQTEGLACAGVCPRPITQQTRNALDWGERETIPCRLLPVVRRRHQYFLIAGLDDAVILAPNKLVDL